MTTYVSAVLWMILSPFAVFTDITAIFVICHYRPIYHGTDLTLISLMVSMAVNAVLVLPLPAVLHLVNFKWNSDLCQFYAWAFITFRIVQLLNLVVLSSHWAAILKFSVIKKQVSTVAFIKSVLPLSWIIAGIVGILPIIGATEENRFAHISCTYLSYDFGGIGFGIFFGIICIVCFIVSSICACDVLVLLKSVRKVALVKYGAGRFYLPKKRSEIPGQGTYTVHERYNQLSVAWDLCRLASIFIFVSFGVNHLPYAVIQFLQITSTPDRQILEEVVLWLVLVEALILPHALWCFSKRYRHAFVYTWKVHICRNSQDEEDPSSCTLQSYIRKSKELNGRATSVGERIENAYNQPTGEAESLERRNGTPTSQVLHERYSQNEASVHKHKNGIIPSKTTGSSEVIATVTIENHTPGSSQEGVNLHGHGIPLKTLSVNIPNTKALHINAQDLKRTVSACSRKEWKDQMIRKHLPAIFVNEAFDTEENAQQMMQLKQASSRHTDGDEKSLNSLHYYVSSDYHPDYLNTDSLHRKKAPRQESDKSESEGVCGQYDEVDIEYILDNCSGTSLDVDPGKLIRQERVSEIDADYDLNESNCLKMQSGESSDDGLDEKHQNTNIAATDNISRFSDGGTYVQNVTMDKQYDMYIPNGPTPVVEIEVQEILNDNKDRHLPDIDTHYLMTESSTDDSDHFRTSTTINRNVIYNTDESQISRQLSNNEDDILQNDLPRNILKRNNSYDHDIIDSGSVECNDSVMVGPYMEETRRPPWMHELDLNESLKSMDEPLLCSSDVDTLQSSNDSRRTKTFLTPNDSPSRSSSLSNSPKFDNEVDKGFEEALADDHLGPGCYVSSGLCFESIKEESDDARSFDSQELFNENETFRTHAIVSKSRSASRSSTSSENPFDMTPTIATFSRENNTAIKNKYPNYANYSQTLNTITNSNVEIDIEDSGVNSKMDFASPMVPRESSPWPDCDVDVHKTDMQFESNFGDTTAGSQKQTQVLKENNTETSSNSHSFPLISDIQPVYF